MKIIDVINDVANKKYKVKNITYGKQKYTFEQLLKRIVYFNDDCSITLNNEIDKLEIIEDKPSKIDLLGKIDDNAGYIDQSDVIKIGEKVDELAKAVNYLLEKSDE